MPAVACYVAHAASNEIFVFALDALAASLELVQVLPMPAGIGPLSFVPETAFLYAMLRAPQPSIASLAADRRTGRLELRATTRVAHPFVYLSTDRAGRYMLAHRTPTLPLASIQSSRAAQSGSSRRSSRRRRPTRTVS